MSQYFAPSDRFPGATIGTVVQYVGHSWAVVGMLENLLILEPAEQYMAHSPAPPAIREPS
jgi:hypothetical protein